MELYHNMWDQTDTYSDNVLHSITPNKERNS